MEYKKKIPKIIHYVWVGTRPLDKLSIKCMKTWKKILPEYEIIQWDDKRCKTIIENNSYARQAYEEKKYAFVSDYIRLYALHTYGGIYMDTDVEIIKNLDCFLNYSAFTSFESDKYIPTALLASEKNGEWIGHLLKYYDNKNFRSNDGSLDFTTNVEIITNMSKEFGFIPNGQEQVLKGDVHIFSKEYFCPLDTKNSKFDNITENTYAIHLFNGSWTPWYRRYFSKFKKRFGLDIEKIIGTSLYHRLKKKY